MKMRWKNVRESFSRCLFMRLVSRLYSTICQVTDLRSVSHCFARVTVIIKFLPTLLLPHNPGISNREWATQSISNRRRTAPLHPLPRRKESFFFLPHHQASILPSDPVCRKATSFGPLASQPRAQSGTSSGQSTSYAWELTTNHKERKKKEGRGGFRPELLQMY